MGDFRLDNTLVTFESSGSASVTVSSERAMPRMAVVLDRELATIGDPVADVAMMCAYRHEAFDLIVGEPAAWTSSRLPSAGELASAYEAAGGLPLAEWDFHLALAYYKIAVIAAASTTGTVLVPGQALATRRPVSQLAPIWNSTWPASGPAARASGST
jgi:aminoglycoside phosphotransferase (APT) family kinase protein